MVGELLNRETTDLTLQAALSGHLLLTQLLASTAAKGLKRMVQLGAPPIVVADACKLIFSQRLVRKLCPHCSQPEPLTEELRHRAERIAPAGFPGWGHVGTDFRKPGGCDQCAFGFHGRIAVTEAMDVTPRISDALREDASAEQLQSIAISEGMVPMVVDGIQRASAGETTLQEVLRVLSLR